MTTQAGGMDGQDAQDKHARQIERLLGFPGVGPLTAEAIASNLGVPSGTLGAVLEALVQHGRLTQTGDGHFALAARERRR